MKESDSLEEPAREPQAEPVSTISLDELKEAIAVKGRERGFVTSEDLLEGLPVEDLAPEQVEDFLTQDITARESTQWFYRHDRAWLEEVLVEEDFMLMEWRKLASRHARGVQRPSNMD